MREKYRRQSIFREEIQFKQEIVKDIIADWNQYPQFRQQVTYDKIFSLPPEELVKVVENLKTQIKLEQACIKIQKVFRGYMLRKGFNASTKIKHESARKLQAQWKVHRFN